MDGYISMIWDYLADLAVPATLALLAWIVRMLRKAEKDRKAGRRADKALLYDRLKYLCGKHLDMGYLCVDDRENLQELFDAYKGLDGNGFIECMHKQAMKLPMRKEES